MFLQNKMRKTIGVLSISAGIGISSYLVFRKYLNERYKSLDLSFHPDNKSFGKTVILSNDMITKDTHKIRLEMPKNQRFPSDMTFHFYISEPSSNCFRAFTPISFETNGNQPFMDILVKKYSFPTGDVARYICSRLPGSTLQLHGPHSSFDLRKLDGIERIGIIAGGTGISPIYQLLTLLAERRHGKLPDIDIIYGSKTEVDILLRTELNELANTYSDAIRIHYFVDNGLGSMDNVKVGYIAVDDLKSHLPPPKDEKSIVFVCGPPAMMKAYCGEKMNEYDQGPLSGYLKQLGYADRQIYKF